MLFLDEPTSGLDSEAATSLVGTLRSLARMGRTVVRGGNVGLGLVAGTWLAVRTWSTKAVVGAWLARRTRRTLVGAAPRGRGWGVGAVSVKRFQMG